MVTVGIDPHKHVHVAVAVMDDGRPIGKPLIVKNDALLISTLLKWVRSITGGTATWAIEDGRGFARRLADSLLLAGQEVVWVPARLAAGHRRLHAATGAKSDPIDAPPSPGQRSPRPAWTGTGSTSASASSACWSTTGPTWSSAAPWSSTSSRRGARLARPDTWRSHARQERERAGHSHQRGTAQPARPPDAR